MNSNTSIILLTTLLGVAVSYLMWHTLEFSLIVLVMSMVFFYFIQRNNAHRKENLNIIKDEGTLYFYLSDDLLFSKELQPENMSETIREAIQIEMSTIKDITRKICFINFSNDSLLKELNKSIQYK